MFLATLVPVLSKQDSLQHLPQLHLEATVLTLTHGQEHVMALTSLVLIPSIARAHRQLMSRLHLAAKQQLQTVLFMSTRIVPQITSKDVLAQVCIGTTHAVVGEAM